MLYPGHSIPCAVAASILAISPGAASGLPGRLPIPPSRGGRICRRRPAANPPWLHFNWAEEAAGFAVRYPLPCACPPSNPF